MDCGKFEGRQRFLLGFVFKGHGGIRTVNEQIRKTVNVKEIYRYLGYGANIPDDNIKNMIETVLENLIQVIKPKNIYNIYDCRISETEVMLMKPDTSMQCDGVDETKLNGYNRCHDSKAVIFKSKNLAFNLRQCSKVALLAATIGIEADKLMQKYELLNMARASMVQSCGAACIEAYCNILQENICEEASKRFGKKLYLRPRFSPGYGDLSIENQKQIFSMLECTKRAGITLTDSLLMYPTKSVTAFIGLTDNPQSCHIDKCSHCENVACEFRIIEESR